METFYLFLIIFLFVPAVFDLSVGVSNDAVNFMNSAICMRLHACLLFCLVACSDDLDVQQVYQNTIIQAHYQHLSSSQHKAYLLSLKTSCNIATFSFSASRSLS